MDGKNKMLMKIILTLFLVFIINNSTDVVIDRLQPGVIIANNFYRPNLSSINYHKVKNFYQGDNVKIAILDTGAFLQHPDFQDNNVETYNIADKNYDITDSCKHGTSVFSIVDQIAPNANYLIIKYFPQKNCSSTLARMADGILFAVEKEVDIILITSGSYADNQTVQDAINVAYEHNILVIASVGNKNSDALFYPAAYNHVLGIGGVDVNQRYGFSNYGSYVDLMAPATMIPASYYDPATKNYGYIYFSGTSASAPHVAGVAALLLDAKQDLTVDELVEVLESSAFDLGEYGRDDYFGYGKVDAFSAMMYLYLSHDNVDKKKLFTTILQWIPYGRYNQ